MAKPVVLQPTTNMIDKSLYSVFINLDRKSNQGNQDSSGNQKNAIQGKRHAKQTNNNEHKTIKTIQVDELLRLH